MRTKSATLKKKENREVTKLIYCIVGCLISFLVLRLKKCPDSNQNYCISNLSKVISCFLDRFESFCYGKKHYLFLKA